MNKLTVIENNNERVLTTKQLAECYETETNNIKNNFNNNKERFIEGKHYYLLKGEELREFKREVNDIDLVASNVNQLYLWTEKGASRICKILDTNKAWEQFDVLEDTYFNVKEYAKQLNENDKGNSNNVLSENTIKEMFSMLPDSEKTEAMLKLVDRFYPIGGSVSTSVKKEKSNLIVENRLTDELLIQVIKDNYSKLYIRDITHKGVACIAVYKRMLEDILDDIGIGKKELLKFIKDRNYIYYAQVRYGYVPKNHWEYLLNKDLFE